MEQSCRGTFTEQSRNFPGWNKTVKFTCHEATEEAWKYSPTISLTLVIDGGGWSTPHPCSFTPPGTPSTGGCGSQSRSGRVQKTSSPPVLDPRTVRSVTNRYTD